MSIALAGLLAGLVAALLPRPRPARVVPRSGAASEGDSPLRRHRLVLALLTAVGGVAFAGSFPGVPVGLLAGAAVWVVAGRVEPVAVRRIREQARRDLPHVVHLLGVVLGSGASVQEALVEVAGALPGPGDGGMRQIANKLALGVPPAEVWADVPPDQPLAPLAVTLQRAATSGSAVAEVVGRLAEDLAREKRHEVEDRARAVGVKAALPLGLCLLPAFLLIGIVPVVAAALSSIRW